MRAPSTIDPASLSGTMCRARARPRTEGVGDAQQLRQRLDRPRRLGADHAPQHALGARGDIVEIALELEAEAFVARHLELRHAQASAPQLDLHHDVAVGAGCGEELPGVDADQSVGLGAAPARPPAASQAAVAPLPAAADHAG